MMDEGGRRKQDGGAKGRKEEGRRNKIGRKQEGKGGRRSEEEGARRKTERKRREQGERRKEAGRYQGERCKPIPLLHQMHFEPNYVSHAHTLSIRSSRTLLFTEAMSQSTRTAAER